ncbi:hypothetical protein ACFXD5_40525 [Streptomyces sp. NPDC059385]|uniref:hypothetical protein n=1 Tax=Streptomyces sp. NPDC059385 TaxID=3346817 RepID=UPI0036A856A5
MPPSRGTGATDSSQGNGVLGIRDTARRDRVLEERNDMFVFPAATTANAAAGAANRATVALLRRALEGASAGVLLARARTRLCRAAGASALPLLQ